MNIQQDEILTVYFDINAREYQGRWYNDIRAWKVDRNINPAPQPTPDGQPPFTAPTQPAQPVQNVQPAQPTPPFENGGNDGEDLPF